MKAAVIFVAAAALDETRDDRLGLARRELREIDRVSLHRDPRFSIIFAARGVPSPTMEGQPMPARSRPLVLAASLAIALAATPGRAENARADPLSYPCGVRAVRVVPVAARTYAVETVAFAAGPIDVLVTLFTHTHSYNLLLSAQVFAKKPSVKSEMLFAAPAFFTVPDDDVIEAAFADLPAASDTGLRLPCIVSRLIVSDALRPVSPHEVWPTASEREARRELVQLFSDGAKLTAAATLRGDEPVPSCEHPYQQAHFVVEAPPDFSAIARTPGSGTVEVEVVLSPRGDIEAIRVLRGSGSSGLDDEVRRRAAKSTYAPFIFRCEPVRSSYRFVVVYTVRHR